MANSLSHAPGIAAKDSQSAVLTFGVIGIICLAALAFPMHSDWLRFVIALFGGLLVFGSLVVLAEYTVARMREGD